MINYNGRWENGKSGYTVEAEGIREPNAQILHGKKKCFKLKIKPT